MSKATIFDKTPATGIATDQTNETSAISLVSSQIQKAEQMYSVGTLASGIVHELNNPLNAILMNAELGLLMAQKAADSAKLLRILQTVTQEAKRAGQLTRRISEFARIDKVCKEPANLNQIVTSARTLTNSILRRHNVELELCLETALPSCLLDQTACEQMIAQLLINATEANATQIRVTTFSENQGIGFSITDNGSGITVDPPEQIFLPFYTTRQALGKLGLGLSLAQRVVAEHNGSIKVENTAEGTRFTVSLPKS